jgi:hypothetical protein
VVLLFIADSIFDYVGLFHHVGMGVLGTRETSRRKREGLPGLLRPHDSFPSFCCGSNVIECGLIKRTEKEKRKKEKKKKTCRYHSFFSIFPGLCI